MAAPRPWYSAGVTDCSADGKVLVGYTVPATTPTCAHVEQSEAMRWEPGQSAQAIRETLVAKEVQGLDGWFLREATGVSADGTRIVGIGSDGGSGGFRAWIADLPTSCKADLDDGSGTGSPDGGVDIDDLLFFLERFEAGC